MKRESKSSIIRSEIFKVIADGITEKQKIYTYVVNELNVPRPTVRRIAREIVKDLIGVINILTDGQYKGMINQK